MHDDLTARIDKVRRNQARITKHIHAQSAILVASDDEKQARIAKHIHAQSAVLVALDDELCELLTEAARLACDAGHITGDVAAAVVAPK